MGKSTQIRLSGAGGQGLITAGVILAEAALQEGKTVVQTQTYGPEARLGSSKSEVIIAASGRIAYPQVTVPDILICLSDESARKYIGQTNAKTLVLFDSTFVPSSVTGQGAIHRLPITETAVAVGNKMAANTVALAVVNRLANLVSEASLKAAVTARVPAKFRTLNEKALLAGDELARTGKVPAGLAAAPAPAAR